MIIQDGIKIYPHLDWESKIWLSEGTMIAKGTASSGIQYRDNAFKPLKPWRSANEAEREILLAQDGEDEPHLNSIINIIKLPDHVIEELKEYKFQNINSKFKFKHYKALYGEKLDQSIIGLNTYLKTLLIENQPVPPPSFSFNHPNLETVTIYLKFNALGGLHIDNFDGFDIGQTEHAGRRMCINLGAEVRHLLFINQPINTMIEWMKTKKTVVKEYSQWNLYNDFMRYFSEYPVVKIPIQPYEAYIAPTENMIHEGCTEGSTHYDVCLSYRGAFKNTCPNPVLNSTAY
jgi:hypothetical protein